MMKNRYAAIGLTLLFLLTSAFAFGQGPKRERMGRDHDRGMHERGVPLRFMQRALDLSDEQVAEIQRLQDESRVVGRELRAEERELRRQLKIQVDAEQPSQEEIGALVLALKDLRTKMRENHESLKAQIDTVLTPEQLEELEELREHRNRRGPRGPRRPRGN